MADVDELRRLIAEGHDAAVVDGDPVKAVELLATVLLTIVDVLHRRRMIGAEPADLAKLYGAGYRELTKEG